MLQVWAWAVGAEQTLDPVLARMRQYGVDHSVPGNRVRMDPSNIADRNYYMGQISSARILIVAELSLSTEQAQVILDVNAGPSFGISDTVVTLPSWLKGLVYGWGGTNSLALLVLMVFTFRNRAAPALKSATVPFLLMMDFGLMLCSLSGLAFVTEPVDSSLLAGASVCAARIWLLALGSVLPPMLLCSCGVSAARSVSLAGRFVPYL